MESIMGSSHKKQTGGGEAGKKQKKKCEEKKTIEILVHKEPEYKKKCDMVLTYKSTIAKHEYACIYQIYAF